MKQHRRKILFGLIVPLVFGAILAMVFLQTGSLAQANPQVTTETPGDPYLIALNQEITLLEKGLSNDKLSADDRRSLLAKKKTFEKQAAERAEYLKNPEEALKTKLTAIAQMLTITPTIPVYEPTAPIPDGLLKDFYAPRYREADFSTLWIAHTEKGEIAYFAGCLVDNPEQGVIYIEKREDDWTVEKYQTPGEDGSLKISKLKKNRLYMDSKKGKKFIFNLEKKKYVDEFDNPLLETNPKLDPAYPPPETYPTSVPAYPPPG